VNNLNTIIQNNEKKTEQSEPISHVEITPITKTTIFADYDPQEAAQEITLRTRELFEKIRPDEILQKADPKISSDKKFLYLDPFHEYKRNLERLVNFELYQAIQKGPQVLANVIVHLLGVAGYCLKLNNWEGAGVLVKVIDRVVDSNNTEPVKTAWQKISAQDKQVYVDNREYFISSGKKKA